MPATMTRKRGRSKPQRGGSHLGRGEWVLLKFADLERWREARGLSKKQAAEELNVVNSTYSNWSRGDAVPGRATQKRLVEIISRAPKKDAPDAEGADAAMRATAGIVVTYLETNRRALPPEGLGSLVRSVRQAVGC